jgi:integrase/recombinase XerD
VLVLFRRHEKGCRYTSRDERRCRCGIWLDWHVAGKRVRKPLGLRDWQAAQQRARDLEADGFVESGVSPTIEEACKKYLADAEARQLRETTLQKYRVLLEQLKAFAQSNGLVFISDFNLDRTHAFRQSWVNRGMSARKKLEALRTFFGFALDNRWIKENPAKKIKSPQVEQSPVMPYTEEQMTAILKAVEKYPDKANAVRLRALVLLLRYSGLRIMDAAMLSRDRIRDGRLMLRTAKTGTVVHLPLPPSVIQALEACPGKPYPFWTGVSKPKSAAFVWQRSLAKLFKLAGIQDAHAHRFRHSFAVGLLLEGVTIENVSALLGHESVKTTIRHYAPWSLARQQQLEDAVKRTWKGSDLVSTGTYTAQQKTTRKNRRKTK